MLIQKGKTCLFRHYHVFLLNPSPHRDQNSWQNFRILCFSCQYPFSNFVSCNVSNLQLKLQTKLEHKYTYSCFHHYGKAGLHQRQIMQHSGELFIRNHLAEQSGSFYPKMILGKNVSIPGMLWSTGHKC